MSFLTSLGIAILATLILGFLQAKTGIFAMLYHFASGKKSKRYADVLTFYYVIGIIVVTAPLSIAFLSIPNTVLFKVIMAGICFALSFLALFFYYKYEKGAQLYLSRNTVAMLNTGAKKARVVDALLLGIAAGIVEFIFAIPLYMIVSVELSTLNRVDLQSVMVGLEVAAGVIPVFLYHALFCRGLNLADLGRLREKNKNFVRYLISVCYLLIGFALISVGGFF